MILALAAFGSGVKCQVSSGTSLQHNGLCSRHKACKDCCTHDKTEHEGSRYPGSQVAVDPHQVPPHLLNNALS